MLFLSWVRSQDFQSAYCVLRPDGSFEVEPTLAVPPIGDYYDKAHRVSESRVVLQRDDKTYAYGIDGSPSWYNNSIQSILVDIDEGVVWEEIVFSRQDSVATEVVALRVWQNYAYWVVTQAEWQVFPIPAIPHYWIVRQDLSTGELEYYEINESPRRLFVNDEHIFLVTYGMFPDAYYYLTRYSHECDSLDTQVLDGRVSQFVEIDDGFMALVHDGPIMLGARFTDEGNLVEVDTLDTDASFAVHSVKGVAGSHFIVQQSPTKVWLIDSFGDLISSLTDLDPLETPHGTIISPGLFVAMDHLQIDTRCAYIDMDCTLSASIVLPRATSTIARLATGRSTPTGYMLAMLYTDPELFYQRGLAFHLNSPTMALEPHATLPGPEIRIFPNPFNSRINIAGLQMEQAQAIRVYDMLGRRVGPSQYRVGSSLGEVTIDFNRLATGQYFLEFPGNTAIPPQRVLHLK